MNSKVKRVLRWAVPLAVLAVAAAIAAWLVVTKPETPRSDEGPRHPLVAVERVARSSIVPEIHTEGVVRPAREVGLAPRVSGRVQWVADELKPGGVVEAGEPLLRLDRSDFLLALRRAGAEVAAAQAEIAQTEGQRDIAKEEWEMFDRERWTPEIEPSPLALRKPQLDAAKARLESAKAAVAQNQLALSRTVVEAPFDAVVESETVEEGSQVAAGTVVARLVGIRRFWVEVTLPAARLPAIALPGVNAERGAAVTIAFDAGDYEVKRRGRVVQLLSRVAEASRMARVLVAVDDPLGLEDGDAMPLLIGSFVDATIETRHAEPLVELPREALRRENEVWVLDEDQRLDIRRVDVAWRAPEAIWVSAGLEEGERVVTSPLAHPVEGMKLRPEGIPTGDDA